MRKALCVGIDCYEHVADLHGCVNDANSVKAALERNGDGTLNFDTRLMCATSEASYVTRTDLKDAVRELFQVLFRRTRFFRLTRRISLHE